MSRFLWFSVYSASQKYDRYDILTFIWDETGALFCQVYRPIQKVTSRTLKCCEFIVTAYHNPRKQIISITDQLPNVNNRTFLWHTICLCITMHQITLNATTKHTVQVYAHVTDMKQW